MTQKRSLHRPKAFYLAALLASLAPLVFVAGCPSDPSCVDGRVVACACASGGEGVQTCEGNRFGPCSCESVLDGGALDGVGFPDGGLADGSPDGHSVGDPCVPPSLTPDAPPTPGRCTVEGALICDTTNEQLVLQRCVGGDVCVEGTLTQSAFFHRDFGMIDSVEYQWADCVTNATPQCVWTDAGGQWRAPADQGSVCATDSRAVFCQPLGTDHHLPSNAGSADGYLTVVDECADDETCLSGICLVPMECALDESWCESDDVLLQCVPGGVLRQLSWSRDEPYVCRDSTACNYGVRTATFVLADAGPRCEQGDADFCTAEGIVGCGGDNCHGSDVCECSLFLAPCAPGFRCAEAPGTVFCSPDVDCSGGDVCVDGNAIDCDGEFPIRGECVQAGSECRIADGRAVCVSEGTCPAGPTCNENAIEGCCPSSGLYFDDAPFPIPCIPGELVRIQCPPMYMCERGSCQYAGAM